MKQLTMEEAKYLYCMSLSHQLKCTINEDRLVFLYDSFMSKKTNFLDGIKKEDDLLERWIGLSSVIIVEGILPNFSNEDFLKLYPTEIEWNNKMIKDIISYVGEFRIYGPKTIDDYEDWFENLLNNQKS